MRARFQHARGGPRVCETESDGTLPFRTVPIQLSMMPIQFSSEKYAVFANEYGLCAVQGWHLPSPTADGQRGLKGATETPGRNYIIRNVSEHQNAMENTAWNAYALHTRAEPERTLTSSEMQVKRLMLASQGFRERNGPEIYVL